MKNLLPATLLCVFFGICWWTARCNDLRASRAATLLDIPYGSSERQQVDAYLPANRNAQTPLLLMFHGGGWSMGDRKDNSHIATILQQRGIASVSVGYRLVDPAKGIAAPQIVDDMRAGVAKALSLRAQWGISQNKLGTFGISAGGHLALLYAYAYDSLHQVKQTIAYAGPSNLQAAALLARPIMAQMVSQFLAHSLPDSLDAMRWSPATYVTPASPQTLLMHGRLDTTVDPSQSISLDSLLRANNVNSRLVLLDSVGHSIDSKTLNVVLDLVSDAMKNISQ